MPKQLPTATGRFAASQPLARLLAQWGVPPVSTVPLARQLGDRLAWADAILLSQALSAPQQEVGDASTRRRALEWSQAALERTWEELRSGFHDELLAHESAQTLPEQAPALADLMTTYRLHLSQQQRQIAMRAASLREKLRTQLAGASAALARLASLDAVFERALHAQERSALSGLAALLVQRAQRHERSDPLRWRASTWADLQHLLDAELELRLQPTQGLIDALRQAVAADD